MKSKILAEKSQVYIDNRVNPGQPRSSVKAVFGIERARALQESAIKLGGYTVEVVATEGNPYIVLNEAAQGGEFNGILGEDDVILDIRNTGNPVNPIDLSSLYRFAAKQDS